MIRRQTDLASIEMWIKSIMAVLFRLDKKLLILTVAYMGGMVIFSLIPATDNAAGSGLLAVTPFLQNALHVPEYIFFYLLVSMSLVAFEVSIRKAGVMGMLFCLAFAAGAEALQVLVPGREVAVLDLGLHLAGIFFGYVVIQYYLYVTFVGRWE